LVSEARKTVSTIRLSDSFFNIDIVQRKDNYDSLTRGMLTQSTQKQDQFFTDEVLLKTDREITKRISNLLLLFCLGQRILIQTIKGFGRIRLDQLGLGTR